MGNKSKDMAALNIISDDNEDENLKKKKKKVKKKHKETEKDKKKKKRKKKDKDDSDKKKKRKKSKDSDEDDKDPVDNRINNDDEGEREGKRRKTSKKLGIENDGNETIPFSPIQTVNKPIPFPIKYILAPMVGASELPFRLLCRKYGAQVAYTPMISSMSFACTDDFTNQHPEFTSLQKGYDRPLVCHFSANDPEKFAIACKKVEPYCDAIDINLGCPQRTAYLEHFGSYLIDPNNQKDRDLVLSIVKAGNEAVKIPIFCKIRLLDTLEETIDLCRQLKEAGASLITIHARYRATFERNGPGARDGPALLDQVQQIKKVITGIPIISNGNVITYDDVKKNLEFTNCEGIMSAEGILDNPAIFLPQLGQLDEDKGKEVTVLNCNHIYDYKTPTPTNSDHSKDDDKTNNTKENSNDNKGADKISDELSKKMRKLQKKLREIQKIKDQNAGKDELNIDQVKKLNTESSVLKQIKDIEHQMKVTSKANNNTPDDEPMKDLEESKPTSTSSVGDPSFILSHEEIEKNLRYEKVTVKSLYKSSQNKINLCREYLNLCKLFPQKMRTVIFHSRRMCRDLFNQYELMDTCVNQTQTIEDIETKVLNKIEEYQSNPSLFEKEKADKEKQRTEEKEKSKHEENKRKKYEGRMKRKAKREGKPLDFYLNQGMKVPSTKFVEELRDLAKNKNEGPTKDELQVMVEKWKEGNHSQHCLMYHLNMCKRGNNCAFLHTDIGTTNKTIPSTGASNKFHETDEVAG